MKKLVFKLILAGTSFLNIQTASAEMGHDSVAVFWSANKTVILVKEQGSTSRLQEVMKMLSDADSVKFENSQKNIRVGCAKTTSEASCTLGLDPGEGVGYGDREVHATLHLPAGDDLKAASFIAEFENSRGDYLKLQVEGNTLHIWANKRR